MHRIFIGYDHRQPISYQVLSASIIARASEPVTIAPLLLPTLKPFTRRGLTPFTFSRFLVPHLCKFEGWALFLDIDMLVLWDIAELFHKADDKYAALISKNPIHKFEWASAILFNCGHPANRLLTPEYVEQAKALHSLNWLSPELIGDFGGEWNHLVGYDPRRTDARLVHYTQGVPCWPEIQGCEYSEEWHAELSRCNSALPWVALMGQSVHAVERNGHMVPRLAVSHQ